MPARQAFALGRIIVVPSRAEAMPYIVLEALAAGKPMIATAVGGIPEIFGAGSPALVRPDAGELADSDGRCARRPRSLRRARCPTLPNCKARFGAEVMAAEIEKAYFAALKR